MGHRSVRRVSAWCGMVVIGSMPIGPVGAPLGTLNSDPHELHSRIRTDRSSGDRNSTARFHAGRPISVVVRRNRGSYAAQRRLAGRPNTHQRACHTNHNARGRCPGSRLPIALNDVLND